MKKLAFLSVLFLFLLSTLFLTPRPVSAQSCVGDYQSCDQNSPCCNFPSFTCQGAYCEPASPQCGTNTLPCCDPPNPQCGSDLDCVDNYCVQPPTCGGNGQNCCPGNTCAIPSLICLANICVADPGGFCGGQGEPCCTAPGQNPCETGLECNPSTNFCQLSSGGGPTPVPGGGGENALCTDNVSINTAIGCIPVKSPQDFARFFLRWGIGIAGGLAFLLMVFAGFQIITSSGDPKRLQAGRELLTSAIAGLLLLIFAAFILRIIGVDILQIPGF